MFLHYITLAIRNIKKFKVSFFINLIGLSLGLASAFIISSYVLKETSYDQFHSKKDRIYRVLCDNEKVNWTSPGVPYVLKGNIDNSVPIVEKSCLMDFLYMAKVKQGEEYAPFKKLFSSTPEFFDIFDCNLVYGSLNKALQNINSLVITKTTANEYFPDENPIGKILEIKIGSEIYSLRVDAVIEDFPINSSIKFNALCNSEISVNQYESMPWSADYRNNWNLNFSKMYVLLKEDKPEAFQKAWDQFEKNNEIDKQQLHYHLQALTDIHLNSSHLVNDGARGNKTNIYLFSSIAFIILIVAAFNYIILSISISKMRYKEIGIKKILGSNNSLIRKQFFSESIIITFLSFPIAYLIAVYSIGFVNRLFNMSLEINIFNHFNQLATFILILILLGLISGSYIAVFSSRLNPLEIIKFKLSTKNRKIRFQHVMLLFQIMVFTGLTGASFSIYKQISYLKNIDTGINLKNKLIVIINDLDMNVSSSMAINDILTKIPEIKDFTMGTFMPPENSRSIQTAPDPHDNSKNINYEVEPVSHKFFDFFDIKCKKGRLFDPLLNSDSSKIIINESAIELLGFSNPIGEKVNGQEIIGVIANYHTHSLHENIAPTVYVLVKPEHIYEIGIEYQPGLGEICSKKVMHELQSYNSDASFDITYVEDKIKDMYYDESNLNNIIIYFSIFAIIIALIGIFGQSLFAVKQQIKEIGIRKVNGATERDIIKYLLKKYLILCVIANAVSWPIIYNLIEKWQERFIYKSSLSISLILLTLAVSSTVVIFTVLINAWKASKTNPVEIIKYE